MRTGPVFWHVIRPAFVRLSPSAKRTASVGRPESNNLARQEDNFSVRRHDSADVERPLAVPSSSWADERTRWPVYWLGPAIRMRMAMTTGEFYLVWSADCWRRSFRYMTAVTTRRCPATSTFVHRLRMEESRTDLMSSFNTSAIPFPSARCRCPKPKSVVGE